MSKRYVIGDVHGCYQTLKKLLKETIKIQKDDELYFIGDFIDRGPSSKEVLDYLIQLKWEGYCVFPLMGNHEDMLIKAYHDPDQMHTWFNNGAEYSLRSFGVPEYLLFEHKGIRSIPDNYIAFMKNMKDFIELDDFIIVHAGLNLNIKDPFSDRDTMLWARHTDYKPELVKSKTIIHGHTPTPLDSLQINLQNKSQKVLNIDTGCVYSELPGYGILTAIDIDSKKLFTQKNIDKVSVDQF